MNLGCPNTENRSEYNRVQLSRIVKHGDYVEWERDHLRPIQESVARSAPSVCPSFEDSHAVGFEGTIAGNLQLLLRLRIQMCLSIVESIFFDDGCGGKDFGMLNRPRRLPSSCRACESLGSPCRPCQTENGTSWVIAGSSKVEERELEGLESHLLRL